MRATKDFMRNLWIAAALVPTALFSLPTQAWAGAADGDALTSDPFAEAKEEFHPWVHYPQVKTIDLGADAREAGDYIAEPMPQPAFDELDAHKLPDDQIQAAVPSQRDPSDTAEMPAGWVQQGSVVLPSEVADGLKDVGTGPIFAVEDIPGNQYPRKHTLFLNFGGGMLTNGSDNSAEGRSSLALTGIYPTFGGGESVALAVIQATEANFEQFGIRIVYETRPRNVVPYTMEMVGGSWMDTSLSDPAGGVAPGADCGALGQRHVVYTFSNGGSVNIAANTIAQEAGHAYGLDHSFNCNSVMSYCGGSSDGSFQNGCDNLCENSCQGSAGCRLTHDMFCGEGNDQQDDVAEMAWIFGGNEPDMEAPTVDIQSPVDGAELDEGSDIELRAVVSDNYGGFGWKFLVTKDGEVIYDQPDYDRDVDAEFRAALNLSNLEAGVWTFTVEAEDQYEHVTSQTVTVNVGGVPATSGGSDSDTDGGDESSGGVGSDSASGTGGGSDSAGDDGSGGAVSGSGEGGDPAADDGGGCRVGRVGGQGSLASLFLLALAGIARRRRECVSCA